MQGCLALGTAGCDGARCDWQLGARCPVSEAGDYLDIGPALRPAQSGARRPALADMIAREDAMAAPVGALQGSPDSSAGLRSIGHAFPGRGTLRFGPNLTPNRVGRGRLGTKNRPCHNRGASKARIPLTAMQTNKPDHTPNTSALAAVPNANSASGEKPSSANPEPLPNPNSLNPATPSHEPLPSSPQPVPSTLYGRRRRELLREYSLVRVETEVSASVATDLDSIARRHGQSRSAYLSRILQSHVRRHSGKY